jgi:hypothetical protein
MGTTVAQVYLKKENIGAKSVLKHKLKKMSGEKGRNKGNTKRRGERVTAFQRRGEG